jgi:polyisoprenoid-binding protein YceI
MLPFVLLAGVLATLGVAPPARAQTTFNVDTGASTLTYHVVHKLHRVSATSKKAEGKAMLGADGKAQVIVRVPIESFDSGNVNRDEHAKEVVEAARYPLVEFKAVGVSVTPPAQFPATEQKTFKVQLSFHGNSHVFEVPVSLTWESAERVRAKASFNVSLDAYKVERPSLMFVKIEDNVILDADLVFKK